MATVNDALRNGMADYLATSFKNGTTPRLRVGTAAMALILGEWIIDATQGAASTGVWTVTFTSAQITLTGGAGDTAAAADMRDHTTPTYTITGMTVSTSGADLNFDSVTWTSGQSATISSFTITVPAATA